MMVDALQAVGSLAHPLGRNDKGIVDEAYAQGLRFFDFIPYGELFEYVFHSLKEMRI